MTRWRSRSKLRFSPARLDSDRRFDDRYPIAAIRFAWRSGGLRPMLLNNSLFERGGIAASVLGKGGLATAGSLLVLASLFFAYSDRHACCFWLYRAQPSSHSA